MRLSSVSGVLNKTLLQEKTKSNFWHCYNMSQPKILQIIAADVLSYTGSEPCTRDQKPQSSSCNFHESQIQTFGDSPILGQKKFKSKHPHNYKNIRVAWLDVSTKGRKP
jgi:hypothetical protein